jgi:hypothetical protein
VAEEAARLLDALSDWGAAARSDAAADTETAAHDPGVSRCPTCGAENGAGQAVVCQLCPVCQGLGLLRSVRPETVDRLADLAGAVAATLRDLATQRRDATSEHGTARSAPVQDIPVDDEPGSAAP